MRKLFIILLFACGTAKAQFTLPSNFGFNHTPASAPAGIALVGTVGAGGNINSVTTGTLNTSGANLLVACISSYTVNTATMSDSKSNTWTALTKESFGSEYGMQIFYCYSPSVGSGHTFTSNGSAIYSSIQVFAFSGTSGGFDAENGAGGSTALSTGSVTPAFDGEVLIAGLSFAGSGLTGITSGFTNYDIATVGGQHYGLSAAYYIQPTAASQDCTFTWASGAGAARIAAFK